MSGEVDLKKLQYLLTQKSPLMIKRYESLYIETKNKIEYLAQQRRIKLNDKSESNTILNI